MGLGLGVGAEGRSRWHSDYDRGGTRLVSPEANAESVVQGARRRLGLGGLAITVSAACASGNYALAQARRWLQLGWVDVCLAGACDMAVTPMSLAGFCNLPALSPRNATPPAPSRPFHKDPDPLVIGEGRSVFLL